MSLPSDLLDQLLTGYLDDALSPDERARVNSLLESDPQVASELADLRELQASLRGVAAADSSIKLDAGFADRVLGAAVDRARTEGLGDDHPLVRLTDQPSGSPISTDASFPLRYAGILVALAASITIAVVTLRPGPIDNPLDQNLQSIAKLPSPNDVAQDDVAQEKVGTDDAIAGEPINERMLANRSSTAAESVAKVESSDASDTPEPEAITSVEISKTPLTLSASADVPQQTKRSPAVQLGAILVLDVRLTAAGHMDNAIASSMRTAELDKASEQELPESLVGSIGKSTDGITSSDDVAIIYLQASAKTLDRFYLSLLADKSGVESVGMSLAMNAPILQVVQSLSPDPTTVRHTSRSLELSSEHGVVNQLVGQLDRLEFAPLNREMAGAMSPSGPDVPAQILLLVR